MLISCVDVGKRDAIYERVELSQPKNAKIQIFLNFLVTEKEAKGKIERTKGKIRKGAGRTTLNEGKKIKGVAEIVKGKIKEDLGKAKRKI